jgi:hypothetical protein
LNQNQKINLNQNIKMINSKLNQKKQKGKRKETKEIDQHKSRVSQRLSSLKTKNKTLILIEKEIKMVKEIRKIKNYDLL